MKFVVYREFLLGLAFASSVAAPAAQAEIVIHGTRVIYPSDAREVTLQVSNNGSKPALVQAWIDEGDPKYSGSIKSSFYDCSSNFSCGSDKSQTLRITALPNASQFNQKQETVLWLNVLDIPPRPTSKMQIRHLITSYNLQFVPGSNSSIVQLQLKKMRI